MTDSEIKLDLELGVSTRRLRLQKSVPARLGRREIRINLLLSLIVHRDFGLG
jgi:hypothetical protein